MFPNQTVHVFVPAAGSWEEAKTWSVRGCPSTWLGNTAVDKPLVGARDPLRH